MILDNFNVPLTGLAGPLHALVMFLLGIGLSIITAYLFPRIFAPLFLKIKGKIYSRYANAYIKKESIALTARKYLIRSIYVVLLILGFLAFIIPLVGQYTIDLWMTEDTANALENEGVILIYSMDILISHVALLLPIVVGIWSIGWAMEDAGLMHYKFDERKGRELYEIEPVHVKYNSYVKGYAGISALLFFIKVLMSFSSILDEYPNRFIDLFGIMMLPFIAIGLLIPAYIIYCKTGNSFEFLNKDLMELKQLTKEEILN
ncbi:MAG: hypothetical protein ACTSR8_12750 [Promethearchaeota archaeon]